MLEGLENGWNTEWSQDELVWATIGRFGLEEELQAVRWKEELLQVQFISGSYNIPSLLSFPKSAKTFAANNVIVFSGLDNILNLTQAFLLSAL